MPRNLIFLKLSHLVVEVGGVYFNAPEKIPAFAVLVAAWRYFERTHRCLHSDSVVLLQAELRVGHGNASAAQRSIERKDHFLIGE